jgi:hypothetical protein
MSAKLPTIITPPLFLLIAFPRSHPPYNSEADVLQSPTRVGYVINVDQCSIGSSGQINRPAWLNLCIPSILTGYTAGVIAPLHSAKRHTLARR